MKLITWTPEMYGRFTQALQQAQKDVVMEFDFEGNTFVVAYAEHLAAYLADRFASPVLH